MLLVSFPAPSRATLLDVYVLAGQSNMSGWGDVSALSGALAEPQTDVLYHVRGGGFGYLRPTDDDFGPELSFGRTLGDAELETPAVVKSAKGSTSLAVDWNPSGSDCYNELLTRVNNARQFWTNQGYDVRIAGIAWMQGEEDAKFADMSAAYATNLVDFISQLRYDLLAPDVPFVYGLIRGSNFAYRDVVRDAQRATPAIARNAYVIDTDDLTTYEGLHFDTVSQIALGQRFATAMLGLRSNIAGDANGDGVVDLTDLNAVRNNFGGIGEGDVTHDGRIGLDDLNLVRNAFGEGIAHPVPEPSSLALLALGTAGIVLVHGRELKRQRLEYERACANRTTNLSTAYCRVNDPCKHVGVPKYPAKWIDNRMKRLP